jgi:hypothetical protein
MALRRFVICDLATGRWEGGGGGARVRWSSGTGGEAFPLLRVTGAA